MDRCPPWPLAAPVVQSSRAAARLNGVSVSGVVSGFDDAALDQSTLTKRQLARLPFEPEPDDEGFFLATDRHVTRNPLHPPSGIS